MLFAQVQLRAAWNDHGARAASLRLELRQFYKLLLEVNCLQDSAKEYASY